MNFSEKYAISPLKNTEKYAILLFENAEKYAISEFSIFLFLIFF